MIWFNVPCGLRIGLWMGDRVRIGGSLLSWAAMTGGVPHGINAMNPSVYKSILTTQMKTLSQVCLQYKNMSYEGKWRDIRGKSVLMNGWMQIWQMEYNVETQSHRKKIEERLFYNR